MPILTLVDTFTMPRLLVQRLGDEAAALYQFGLYNHGIPLVQLVAMIASSMSAAIVPAVADAKWKGDTAGIKRRTESSLRLTWYVGLAASFGLAVLAEPMNVMFFKSAEGSSAMAILGFTALFSTLNIIAGSVLQGSGAIVAPAVYLLVAAALKVAGNALLMPRYGIDGAAIAAVIAYAAAGGLALAHAMRATGAEFSLRDYVYRPLGAILVMCAALVLLQRGCAALQELAAWPLRGEATVVALGGAALGALVYAAALLRVRAIGEAELRMVPKLGDKQLAALRRCRLIP
jgi:O-antigen/teichoic acid export membrane protein